ncbi:dermonecrotic toxin SPH [Rhipicephalus sanguineus]|uniref:dermonecrotic toxin SPH n=1 Tax=Rhipicephalus sanguineus TaxID=34632 RepID=UPI001894EEDB|nr:dermonecrotic toxin SPH [Rhipicephalus sanguineus]XP_037524545.1 dermonecrotic toxin SPH [Rhipicephalus sanguineus]
MTVNYILIAFLLFLNICCAEMYLDHEMNDGSPEMYPDNEIDGPPHLGHPHYPYPMPPPRAHAKRPFYIIGHMVNSVEEVDKFLRQGSNALEVDIEFAENGTVLGTYHGMPCDCFRGCFKRTPIAEFLDHLRNVTSMRDSRFRGQMSLLFLDLKTTKLSKSAKPVAGVTLAYNLVKHLWKGVHPRYRMNVLLSIGYVKDRDVTRGALAYLKKKGHGALLRNIGFDVGMNDPLDNIARMYKKLHINGHRWQGDGLSNCLRFLMPVDRLKAAVKLRDSKRGYIDKVYHWTIDLPFYIEKSIRLGVDGIITNQPHNVLGVVTSIFFQKRLKVASMKDSPWQKIRRTPQEVLEDEGDTDTNMVGGGDAGPGK